MIRAAVALFAVLWLAGAPGASFGASVLDREAVKRIVVQEALGSERVPPSLALAVAEAESNFIADAESPAGARGVMQIMPATGRGVFGVEPDALWEPRLNVRLGIAFLDQLIERYGERWDLALSHYNGGSRVGSGPEARVIPATRGYVDKVLRLERRNARDEAVGELVAAAEAAARPAGFVERLPVAARGAARLAAVEIETREWQPELRRRRYVEFATDAVDSTRRPYRRAGPVDSAEVLQRIETQRTRFRTLLATSGGRS